MITIQLLNKALGAGVSVPVSVGLTSYIGPRGPAGADGADGAQGPQGPAGPIAGTDRQVIFNDAGVAAGDAGLTFDKATGALNVGGGVQLGSPSYGVSATSNIMHFTVAGGVPVQMTTQALAMRSGQRLVWSSSATNPTGAEDLSLQRGGPGILEQRNGANAQAFRIYNTYTDANNHERAFFRWVTNELQIGTEAGGSGTQRGLRFSAASIAFANPPKVGPFTVGTLPSASTSGATAIAGVTDLTSLANGTVAAGGGALKGIVKSDGTNWIVLG